MIKLILHIDFVRILFKRLPERSHFVNFTIENNEGDQLNFEQKYISTDNDIVELDKLASFEFYMIVDHNKLTMSPFELYFISKLNPPIRRRMPLHTTEIFDHYIAHQLFSDVDPLEQVYAFEEGEVIYKVYIQSVDKVSDADEFQKMSEEIKKLYSMVLDHNVRPPSEGNGDEKLSGSGSTVLETQSADKGLKLQQVKQVAGAKQLDLPLRTKRLLARMSIEEIAEEVDQKNRLDEKDLKKNDPFYHTNVWYIKLDQKLSFSHEQEQQHSTKISLKVKLLVILIVLGFMFMVMDSVFDFKMKERGVPSKRQKKQKARRIKIQQ